MDTTPAGNHLPADEFTVRLPDGRPIKAYTDSQGRVVTRHGSASGGPPRFLDDVFIKAVRRMRPLDVSQPPPSPDPSGVPNSAHALQDSDEPSTESSSVTTTNSYLQAVAIEVSPPSGRLSLGSPILSRKPYDWALVFFIRPDLAGSFHLYPHIGGPYQSIEDADNAIARHLDDRREKNVCLDGLSRSEIMVRRAMHLPDGTRRKLSEFYTRQESRKNTRLMVQALLDKYNDDHNRAYELKDVVCIRSICEGSSHSYKWYYHLNLTARTQGEDVFQSGIDNLFFAEITRIGGAYNEFAFSSFYMLKPNDNGHCRGCTNIVSVNLKHPNEGDLYTGGHLEPYLPFGGETNRRHTDSSSDNNLDPEEEEARLQAEKEARLRRNYKCFDCPIFLEKMRRRFKDDPRAETHFQPRKGVDPQRATPLAEDKGAAED